MSVSTPLRKKPLSRPLLKPSRPPLGGPSTPSQGDIEEADPRPPCMKCGKRPSEVIVGTSLEKGLWICGFCRSRGA